MTAYSPQRNETNVKVANLARDSWEQVDLSGRVADFSQYECFIVFHAGSGREVDLVSLLGFDPTPRDIPSLFVGLNAFREFYGQNFPGILVNGGQDTITNSIVVPETENRTLPTATGDVLLELSINGLLCASVGSFLGLPDLFDTNTGRSGIGRFGLMDGQSIFSFAGLFPPEPSAWEKYWLGWIDPIVVEPGQQSITLPAVGFQRADSIYRVPISVQEYFLAENRNRDPLLNGQTVTSTFNGLTRVQTFAHDTAGFNAFDVSGLAGVVTDVEDLDWSVPGGVDPDGTFFDGGVLIWHIDEVVIAQNIRTNSVNANPERRGVDLEEADGSQDIGQDFGFLSPGAGSEEGTPLDLWYEGNSAPVFKNEFCSTSFPNSFSNGQANGHITLRDFSVRGPQMIATAEVGDEDISPLPGFPKVAGETLAAPSLTVGDFSSSNQGVIIVSTTGIPVPQYSTSGVVPPADLVPGKIFAWKSDGMQALPTGSTDGLFVTAGTERPPSMGFLFSPALADLNNDNFGELVSGEGYMQISPPIASVMRAFTSQDADSNARGDEFFAEPASRSITAPPVVGDSIIAFGATGGRVYFLRLDGTLIDSLKWLSDSTADVSGVSRFVGPNEFIITGSDGSVILASRGTNGSVSRVDKNFGREIVGPAVAGTFGSGGSGDLRVVFATKDGYLYIVDEGLNIVPRFPIQTGSEIGEPPALADVNGDGLRDIVVFSGFQMYAFNVSGSLLDFFPITVHSGKPLASAPVVADVDGDGNVEIVGATDDGLVFAYDKNGRLAPGFPLQAGTGRQSVAVFTFDLPPLSAGGFGLIAASSDDGSVSAWRTGIITGPSRPPNHPWPQYQKDAQHSGLATEPLTGTPLSSEFFPTSRAYNWPNPVYDGKTFLRYFVREDASVNVKVFDLAGDLVTEFSGPGIGGVDNQVEWDVSGIESGIYFARIEANGTSRNGFAIVKVAVVK
jgi:hypothetical protein